MKTLKKIVFVVLVCLATLQASSQNGLTVYGMPSGYTTVQVRYKNCITTDSANNVYVGFRDIGLGKFIPATSTWVMFDTINSGIPSNNVLSLAVDNAGNIWAGTVKGLSKFDGSIWTNYNTTNSLLLNDTVTCIKEITGGIFIGTRNGLNYFDGTNWNGFNTSNSGLINDTITCLDIDSALNILVGTSDGLSIYDGNAWTNYTTANSGLISNQIRQVKYISSKATWISTSAGINKLFNSTVTSYSCYSSRYHKYYTSYPAISKKDNRLYMVSAYLNRIDEDEFIDFAQVGLTAFGNYLYPYTSIAFDSNGLLWTAYCGTSSSGLSSFSENSSTVFYNASSGGFSFQKDIDINNVRALMQNRGDMFWDLVGSPQYEVPKCSNKNAAFAAALWIGGYDQNGNLHIAAQTYRQAGNNDYLPGPLDTTNAAMDSLVTMAPYDNIWKIDRSTIDTFKINFLNGNVTNGTYPVPTEILTYPAIGTGNITRNLAPYIDYNGDGNYNPYDGDYPKIKGDQQLYWIFNDQTTHTETGGLPLGIEVHAYVYAYSCDQYNLGDSNAVIDYTTFYKYEIINRSQNTYDSVFIGLWTDVDLGDYNDDFVGCDTVLNTGFSYNGDNDDGTGTAAGYGLNPPMINCQILKGPEPVPNDGVDNDHDGTFDEIGEMNMMSTFKWYQGDFTIFGNPEIAIEYYHFLRSRWKNGIAATNDGANGYNVGFPPTNYVLSGVPYDTTAWNEYTAGNVQSDRRFILSSGPFSIAPGQSKTIDFAYVFTWDSTQANGLNTSIARNTADLQRVKYWFDTNNFPSCLSTGVENISVKAPEIKIYPNPTTQFLNVSYNSSSQPMRIEIYDVTGRRMMSKKINTDDRINVSKLSPAVYFIKVYVDGNVVAKKFIKQ